MLGSARAGEDEREQPLWFFYSSTKNPVGRELKIIDGLLSSGQIIEQLNRSAGFHEQYYPLDLADFLDKREND